MQDYSFKGLKTYIEMLEGKESPKDKDDSKCCCEEKGKSKCPVHMEETKKDVKEGALLVHEPTIARIVSLANHR